MKQDCGIRTSNEDIPGFQQIPLSSTGQNEVPALCLPISDWDITYYLFSKTARVFFSPRSDLKERINIEMQQCGTNIIINVRKAIPDRKEKAVVEGISDFTLKSFVCRQHTHTDGYQHSFSFSAKGKHHLGSVFSHYSLLTMILWLVMNLMNKELKTGRNIKQPLVPFPPLPFPLPALEVVMDTH